VISVSKLCKSRTKKEHWTYKKDNYQQNESISKQVLPYLADFFAQRLISIVFIDRFSLVKVSLNLSKFNPLEVIQSCLGYSPIDENSEFKKEGDVHEDIEDVSVHCSIVPHHEICLHQLW
jgi:hypothetical protein